MEIWLDVKDHPKYEVSNYGNIRNKRTGKILKQILNRPGGYLRVGMDGKHQYVHRIVADTFFDGNHAGIDVNHIDGNKRNNHISNLEWCTRKENIQHAYNNELKYPSRIKIVRCKFCKYRDIMDFCKDRPDDFFCADGEKGQFIQ